MRLSVVIPCFNEKDSVARYEAELFPELEKLRVDYEVLAVDDGSTDGTFLKLQGLAGRNSRLKILSHSRNRGLGAALRTAFAAATGEWMAVLDADLTWHPSRISDLLARQKETGADLVAGSPFLAPGGHEGVPLRRRLPSLLLNAFYRGLLSRRLTSYTPIFRLYRTDVLKSLPLASEGFEISAEIAARFLRAGKTLTEVPAVLTSRREGASKLAPWRELRRHGLLIGFLLANPR